MTITTENGWLTDGNGNKASIKYFGSEDAARNALLSLKNCRNCVNCSDCSDCSYCSDCSDCLDCLDCSGCSDCSDCSDCLDCSYCSYCLDCSYCSYCSGCRDSEWKTRETSNLPPIEVPVIQNIHQAIFAAASAEGAMDMAAVHLCNTTHSRAGWAVHLAGGAGYGLESRFGWNLAARMIYEASGYKISSVEFYKSNDDALADMKRLADLEKVSQ